MTTVTIATGPVVMRRNASRPELSFFLALSTQIQGSVVTRWRHFSLIFFILNYS